MKVEIMNANEEMISVDELIAAAKPLVFEQLSQEINNVYTVLCPRHKEWKTEEIQKGIEIPNRVKDLIQYCHFDSYEVWSATAQVVKDPILVGIKQGENSWDKTRFLVARWGKELEAFSVLRDKAKESLKRQTQMTLIEIKLKAETVLKNLDLYIECALTEKISTTKPYVNWSYLD